MPLFNARHGRTGTLWEGRYKASLVASDHYLLQCLRYIELNPLRAAITDDPARYRLSSCQPYLGLRPGKHLAHHPSSWPMATPRPNAPSGGASSCAKPSATTN